jgi:hypothetical protein
MFGARDEPQVPPYLHRENDGPVFIHAKSNVGDHGLLEALRFSTEFVGSYRQWCDGEVTGLV